MALTEIGNGMTLTATALARITERDSSDDDPENLAEENSDNLLRPSLMAMLVHWTYFRDSNMVLASLAWVADYTNDRAMDYANEHWEPYHHAEDLKELGLAFLRRKRSHRNRNAPALAILLRGTIPIKPVDIIADLRLGAQELNKSSRVLRTVRMVVQVVGRYLRENPNRQNDICLAGHSLGAAIALVIGGTLYATYGVDIDTHLFNPPLVTVVDVLTGRARLDGFDENDHVAELEVNFEDLKQVFVNKFPESDEIADEWEQVQKLKDWVPQLYLNPGDLVCRLFIEFYKSQQGQKLEVARDLISYQGLLSRLFGREAKYFKDVVPSADLHISTWKEEDPRLAHSLRQWHKFKPEYIGLQEVYHARLLREGRVRRI